MSEKIYTEFVCEVHPFTEQQLYFGRNTQGKYEFIGTVPLTQLCECLVCNCHDYGAKKIHLVGPSSFLKRYVEDIKYTESCQYGNCTIEVEIN